MVAGSGSCLSFKGRLGRGAPNSRAAMKVPLRAAASGASAPPVVVAGSGSALPCRLGSGDAASRPAGGDTGVRDR